MGDLIKRFYKFWWAKKRFLVLLTLASLCAIMTGIIWLLSLGSLLDKWPGELLINIFASLIGFLAGVMAMNQFARSLSKHEDEQKVCFDDKKLEGQYKQHYWHEFTIPNHKPAHVYAELLFVMSRDKELEVHDDPDLRNLFEPDTIIKAYCMDILPAHGSSKIPNGLTVRLKNIEEKNNKITITTHRSTYIAHLLTNRAIDYKIVHDISLRTLFEGSDTLTPLYVSKMSNHIGINVFVFLKDRDQKKYILLPERDKVGTIAKGQITASWATRLTMDDYSRIITENYLAKGVICDNWGSFCDAMMVDKDFITEKDINIQLLGATRDIYEGGKPTFFYIVELKKNVEDYLDAYNNYKTNIFPKKDQGHDAPALMYIAQWNSLMMNKNDKMVFTALNVEKNEKCKRKKNLAMCKEITVSCEKNLLAGLYVYSEYDRLHSNSQFPEQ